MRNIDRLDKYMKINDLNDNQITVNCDLSVGLLGKARQGKSDIGKKTIEKILTIYQDLNKTWLLTGEGSMLKSSDAPYSINQELHGTPYYDVDFIGGFDLVQNDQTRNPAYHIQFQAYNKADCWVNITGHSMEPLISHGDIIALKKIEDWHTYILYGETYAVVTDEYRTVKKVRKSTKGDNFLRLVPINPEFDEQDISKEIILYIYQVIGCAKKIF